MRKSGQITVFLSLVMLCVCSLVCGLVESARTAGAGWYLKMRQIPPWILYSAAITGRHGSSTGFSCWNTKMRTSQAVRG